MFQKATKRRARLRLALIGPSGSGKSMTALKIAKGIGGKWAAIDTEHGSLSKYADVMDFDVVELDSFSPREYVKVITAAEAAGYDGLIIDSWSHAWSGKGGALEMVDNAAKRSQSGNKFMAWRDVTPEHNAMVEAIVGARLHVIATMRAKTEWVVEEDARGKKVPRKVGLAPIQRDGVEYEFDVTADMTLDHDMIVSKTRCPALDGQAIRNPGEDVAEILRAWLTDGAEPVERPAPKPVATPQQAAAATGGYSITEPQRKRLYALAKARYGALGIEDVDPVGLIKSVMARLGIESSHTIKSREQYEAVCDGIDSWEPPASDETFDQVEGTDATAA